MQNVCIVMYVQLSKTYSVMTNPNVVIPAKKYN